MVPIRALFLAVIVASVWSVAACGEDDAPDPSKPASTATSPNAQQEGRPPAREPPARQERARDGSNGTPASKRASDGCVAGGDTSDGCMRDGESAARVPACEGSAGAARPARCQDDEQAPAEQAPGGGLQAGELPPD